MSNLSDLLPAGASGKTIEAVATATIASKAPVILNSAGTVSPIAESAVAAALYDLETIASGTQYYGDWCYDTVNDKLVLIFSNSAYSQYPAYTIGSVTTNAVSWTTPTIIFSRAINSLGCCYNATEDRIAMACQDSSLPKAIVGTSDGSTITWGSVVTITNPAGYTPTWANNNLVEWPGTSKVVWCGVEGNLNYQGYACTATLSGSGASATSTWGTAATFTTAGISNRPAYVDMCYDHGTGDQVIITYGKGSINVEAVAAAISGTTMTFGTAVAAISAAMGQYANALAYDTGNSKALMVYGAGATSGNATISYSRVISTTGSVITLGTQADFIGVVGGSPSQYAYGFLRALTYSSHSSNFVFMYLNTTEEDGFVTTVSISGTTNTWSDNQTEYNDNEVPDGNMFPLYDPDTDQAVLCYRDKGTSQYLVSQVYTIPYAPTNLTSTNFVGIADAAITSDATFVVTVGGGKFVIDGVSQDTVSLQEGATYTFDQAAGTNSTHPLRFSTTSDGTHGGGSEYTTGVTTNGTPGSAGAYTRIVVADSAPTLYYYCSNHSGMGGTANTPAFSATGTIVVQGGTVSDANTILPQTMSFGSEAVYESAASTYNSAAFDSDSNRVVIAYTDGGNSDNGTAVVGTVSGTSISYGTPVVFDGSPHGAFYNSATFDSNSNKVVIAYQDAGNSMHGTSIIGTVSGTSISFGTPVIFEAAEVYDISTSFDSTANKVVIAYRDAGNSMYGTAIVGTVSGTSISYGTAVVFESAESKWITSTYDANADRTVIAYMDDPNSDYGTAIVGTVSGTAISFGTAVVFNAAESTYVSSTYDSTAQKVVISYMDGGSSPSNKGTAIVGTVSGTTISFGTEVVFNVASSNSMSNVYYTSANKVVIAYQETSKGYALTGTVSGTTVSFDTPVVFNNIDTSNISTAYNSTDNKIIIAYKDTGNSNYGTGIVGTFGDDTFTVGSKYYVQNDGTITTVSSSVNAGLATSTTQLLLNGDS